MMLKDKICLVVGASSGMGRRTALTAGQAGAQVVVAARRIDACEDVAAQIKASGGNAQAIACDATQPEAVEALIGQIESDHGRLDAAFNNLGHMFGNSPLHETPTQRWHDTIAINLTAIFLLVRAQLPLMMASGGGSIVNNSSTAGLRGTPQMGDYSAAKFGLIGLTRTVAAEYGEHNIRCNVIAPGIIMTEAAAEIKDKLPDLFNTLREEIPAKRFGEMDDVAELVLWLMSDQSRHLNGVTLPIDGGRTA